MYLQSFLSRREQINLLKSLINFLLVISINGCNQHFIQPESGSITDAGLARIETISWQKKEFLNFFGTTYTLTVQQIIDSDGKKVFAPYINLYQKFTLKPGSYSILMSCVTSGQAYAHKWTKIYAKPNGLYQLKCEPDGDTKAIFKIEESFLYPHKID